MTVRDFVEVLRDRVLTVVLVALLGLAGGALAYILQPAEFRSEATLYVSAQVGDNPQQAFQGAQLSEQRVKSYVELATGYRVMNDTVQRLGLPYSPEQLSEKVSASSEVDSVVITISATDRLPVLASQIANTVALVVINVVDELERPSASSGVPAVVVRVVQDAPVPMSPSSISLSVSIVIGLLVGLLLGALVALVRNFFDNSVKTVSALGLITGAPNLASIVYDPKVPQRPLTVQGDSQDRRAESFRQLRTNLQFVDVDKPRKLILVTSSVPGEGKTTTVANLAVALAAAGTRVLVIEADLRRPKLSDVLGLERSVGLTRVLAGGISLRQGIHNWEGGAFDVLPSGPTPPNPSELLSSNQMGLLLHEVRRMYDVVLIDTPPLLPVTDAAAIAPSTDGAVLVCRFQRTTRSQVETATQSLRSVSAQLLGTVLTMVDPGGNGREGKYSSYYSAGVADAATAAESRSPGALPVDRGVRIQDGGRDGGSGVSGGGRRRQA